MDGTFDQVAPLDRLTGFKEGFRFDLKSATDRWPLPALNSLMALPRGFVLGNVLYRRSFDRTNLRCDDTAQQTIH